MGAWKNIVIGIIGIVIAVGLLYVWPDIFFWPMVELIKGGIVPMIAFFALIFLLVGIDELKAEEELRKIEEEEKKERRKRKRKR